MRWRAYIFRWLVFGVGLLLMHGPDYFEYYSPVGVVVMAAGFLLTGIWFLGIMHNLVHIVTATCYQGKNLRTEAQHNAYWTSQDLPSAALSRVRGEQYLAQERWWYKRSLRFGFGYDFSPKART